MKVEIKDKLYKDIVGYCELNNLDVTDYVNDLLKKQFVVEKYGERPAIFEQTKKTEQTKVINEPINEPISEPINEPIKQDETVEIPFTLEPVVVDYSKTEELKPEPPMIKREELMEMYSQEKTQEQPKKRRRKLT